MPGRQATIPEVSPGGRGWTEAGWCGTGSPHPDGLFA